jgi:hypothetical protein
VNWSLAEPPRVRDILASAYDERGTIKRVVTLAGLKWSRAPGGTASAEDVWTWAIEAAVNSGVLFELCGVVFEDSDSRLFHDPLRTLLGGGLAMGYTRRLGPEGFGADSVETVSRKMQEALQAAAALNRGGSLQSINLASLGLVDAQADLQMRRDALRRTAMIEIGGLPAGTGFLVGPDLLLTAAHVLDSGHWPPRLNGATVVAIFDFVPDATRSPAETGFRVTVANAAVAGSLPTANEVAGQTSDWDADANHLDFALVRLATDVAAVTVGGSPRGFYPLHTERYLFDDQAHLQIPQHPLGQTQVTAPAAGPFEINPNETRVRYLANTLPGSSGSAVLDMRGRLVAMHHYATQKRNQGVLIAAIAKHIENAGISLPRPTAPASVVSAPAAPASAAAPVTTAGPDPFETTCFGPRPFVNRDGFRNLIKGMLASNDNRVLVIDGGQDAGKSHSWRYLTHLEQAQQQTDSRVKAQAPGGVRVVIVDLEEYIDLPHDEIPKTIINHLSATMGLVDANTLEQQARTIVNLKLLLETKLFGTSAIWWIFFDSLDRITHSQVNEIISQLGLLIDQKPALPLRLVLSSRESVQLRGDFIQWALRDHALGLSRADVETWLRRRAAELNRSIDAAALATELDAQFPPHDPPPSARKLAPQLAPMLTRVLGGAA